MKRKFKRFKKQVHDFLFDHQVLKLLLEYTWNLAICALSAFIFAFGFSVFSKGQEINGVVHMSIITGGASGLSQSLRMIIELFVGPTNSFLRGVYAEAIFYTAINLPLIIFAFRKVGVRFAALTLVNVALTSVFMPIVRDQKIFMEFAQNEFILEQPLTRALFGGICTGVSTAIAFKGLFSTGGLDIISYYISNKKGSGAGKYSGMLNVINICIYTLLFIGSIHKYPASYQNGWVEAVVSLLYGLVYLVSVMVVVDLINVRNKKVQVQIVTSKESLSDILIANLPHSVTISKAIGGYQKTDRTILTMTISSFELKRVTKVVKLADPNAFIQVVNLANVYGKFFMNPIK